MEEDDFVDIDGVVESEFDSDLITISIESEFNEHSPPKSSLPSNRRKWSSEEKQRLFEAISTYGTNWKKIGELFPSRSSTQIKTYWQYLNRKQKKVVEADHPSHVTPSIKPLISGLSTDVVRISSKFGSDSELIVDVTDCDDFEIKTEAELQSFSHTIDPCSEPAPICGPSALDDLNFENGVDVHHIHVNNDEDADDACDLGGVRVKAENDEEEDGGDGGDDAEQRDENDDDAQNEELYISFPFPQQELVVELDAISDEERQIHSEFFDGRPSKTPDRYLKIRNFIIECWQKNRPRYVNKTSLRTGLKNCGDVNCIGRIHTYLEQKGMINFGCPQVQYGQRVCYQALPRQRPRSQVQVEEAGSPGAGPRKRRPRPLQSDLTNFEGHTIMHLEDGEEFVQSFPKRVKKRWWSRRVDNLALVAYRQYESEKEPFHVSLSATAAATLDVHAHSSLSEVMGLLGGRYDRSNQQLKIMMAEPCRSEASRTDCEMDPVQQIEATERLHARGLDIVGWYHSHPVFPAIPSKTDLETQKLFQECYTSESSRFVGIIVNPFPSEDAPMLLSSSTINCMLIEHDGSEAAAFELRISALNNNETLGSTDLIQLFDKVGELAVADDSRIDWLQEYNPDDGWTFLDKVLRSLSHHCPCIEQEELDRVREHFTNASCEESIESF